MDDNDQTLANEVLEEFQGIRPDMPEEMKKNIRRFFALCKEAGFDPTDAKERVKKKLNLEHFWQITPDALDKTTKDLQSYIDRKILGLEKPQPASVPQAPTKPQSITSQFGSF